MTNARYVLLAVSVFLLGTGAGALAHHRGDSSYWVPIALVIGGVAAALAAWKLDALVAIASGRRRP